MGVPVAAETELRAAERRILASPQFHSSETLSKLLHYLVELAIQTPNQPAKEHQIAIDVLGREESFDPRLDAIVRVQTGRLRHKLQEYYEGPGAGDDLVLELAKGSYLLHLRSRRAAAAAAPVLHGGAVVEQAVNEVPPEGPGAGVKTEGSWGWRTGLLAGLCLCLLIIVGLLAWERRMVEASPPIQANRTLQNLWSTFLTSPEAPILVFSNAEFVGRPDTGMRYLDPTEDAGRPVLDHYTGVGEVNAIFELTQLFSRFRKDVRVKRARLLSLDDAKSANLVFIGSTSENKVLRELPIQQDFAFEWVPFSKNVKNLAIVNRNLRQGEFARLFGSPQLPVQEDYAVVSLLPGLTQGRWIMLLAGTTTLGTQAAVEFACHPDLAKMLIERTGGGALTTPVESVIRAEIRGGVPVQTKLLAVHPR